MQSFLIAEKIQIPKTKVNTPFHPQCTASEDVEKYEDNQLGGPYGTKVLLAWNQPLSSISQWNWDVITILTWKAQIMLKESNNATCNNLWLELLELMKKIAVSLRETKVIMASSSASLSTYTVVSQ